jgi:CheY-like chemotaxis protein
MDGTISVQSKEQQGSTFTVCLPLVMSWEKPQPEPAMPIAFTPPANNNAKKKPHILLVEDNQTNQLIAKTYLNNLHCTHDSVSSGEEALKKVKTQRYDMILMDVQMHDMDGFETTRQIRAIENQEGNSSTPIIAITAHALCGIKEQCLAAGMNDYIAKPFDLQELENKLVQYLK